jgi:nucleoside 2-deoxyribosyltransferase
MKYKVYFAGELFDQKHVTGNYMLAEKIEKFSNGMYECLLPQNWEATMSDIIDIRNSDIKAVMRADLVMLNFDGVDLDSGTVVEFMVAKMLDIPVVLLRTDGRRISHLAGEDWNLMIEGFPRCIVSKHQALVLYNELGLVPMQEVIAQSVIAALDKVRVKESLLSSYEEIWFAYLHVIKMCGGGLDQMVSPQLLREIIASKIQKGIYPRVTSAPTFYEGGAA